MGDYSPTFNPLGLTGPDGADLLRNGDNRIRALIDALSANYALVDVLPGSPRDGQVIYFQDATLAAAQTIWPLKYVAADEEWLGLGSVPLMEYNHDTTEIIAPSSTNLVLPFGSSPTLPVPLTGDFMVDFGAFISIGGVGDAIQLSCTVFEDSTSREDDGGSAFFVGESAVFAGCTLARKTRMDLTGGSTLSLRYTNATSLSASTNGQMLSITPIRIPA